MQRKVIKKRAKRLMDTWTEKGEPGFNDVQLAGFNLY